MSISKKSKRLLEIEGDESSTVNTNHQMTVQEKWFMIASLIEELSGKDSKNAYSSVAQKLKKTVNTVRRVADEYFGQLEKDPNKVPDLTPRHHGHAKSGKESHTEELKTSFNECHGHF